MGVKLKAGKVESKYIGYIWFYIILLYWVILNLYSLTSHGDSSVQSKERLIISQKIMGGTPPEN